MASSGSLKSTESVGTAAQLVAVIDVGATAIRMAIGEISDSKHVRTLETLSQAVNLGKDTFNHRTIASATIEQCVDVLKSYRHILREYHIDQPQQIRDPNSSANRLFPSMTPLYRITGPVQAAVGPAVETDCSQDSADSVPTPGRSAGKRP